jgi:NAD+ diphosphatase
MALCPDMNKPNFYASGGFDRAAHLRVDSSWIIDALSDPDTRGVPVWQSLSLGVIGDPPLPTPIAVMPRLNSLPPVDNPIFLGLLAGTAYFALDYGDLSEADAIQLAAGVESGAAFVDLRRIGPLLPRDDGALLATARGMIHWHRRHRFCGVCGGETLSQSAGHVRACVNPSCRATHFPRTDPATIMLVTDGDRCLLGRQPKWPQGMYSTLAGFVEPGESLEDAVIREVLEESGIIATNVTYNSSQPWPFPSSLMVGFFAEAVTREITVDPDELEDAQWFTSAELRRFADQGKFLPRPDSIARRLVETWLATRPLTA